MFGKSQIICRNHPVHNPTISTSCKSTSLSRLFSIFRIFSLLSAIFFHDILWPWLFFISIYWVFISFNDTFPKQLVAVLMNMFKKPSHVWLGVSACVCWLEKIFLFNSVTRWKRFAIFSRSPNSISHTGQLVRLVSRFPKLLLIQFVNKSLFSDNFDIHTQSQKLHGKYRAFAWAKLAHLHGPSWLM